MLQNFFRNKNISKKLKLSLKYRIIDKTLTYASETWILTERERKQINIFERKVYRRILGPVYDNEKANRRILTNKEIYAVVKKPTTTETIKLNRLRWFGHVQRMEENGIPQKVLYINLEAIRLRSRPWNRWQDEVREEWKKLLRMARNRCILHMPLERMNETVYFRHVKLHVHRLQEAQSIEIIWQYWMNIKGGKMAQFMFQWSPLGGGGWQRRNDKDEPSHKESKHTYFIMGAGTWSDWLLWKLKVASALRVKAKKKSAVRTTEKCCISIRMQGLIKAIRILE